MSVKVGLVVLNEFTNDSRVFKEAQSLSRNGYRAQVIALHKRGLARQEEVGGFRVRRIKLISREWPKRKAVQLLKYLEFLARAILICRKFDVLHCNDLNALPVGVIMKWLTLGRIKVVYDAHEFEINRTGNNKRAGIRLTAWLERLLIRHVNAVLTVSPSIAKAYRRIYKIEAPALVLNCPPYQAKGERVNKFREELGIRPEQKIFLYQGGLFAGRGIELITTIFTQRKTDDTVVVFMGYGPLEGTVRAAAIVSSNVFFHTAVSSDVLLSYTASADFGLVTIEKTCLSYAWCLPNKFFEYLMAGLVVVALDLVEVKRIIKRFDLGICATGARPSDLDYVITQAMARDWASGDESRERARQVYCWEQQERVLLEVYAGLLA